MVIWYSPPGYLLGLLAWLALLGFAVRGLLRRRQQRRKNGQRLRGVNAGLAIWSVFAALTAGELVFAFFVDHSDAFNLTNVSRRWFERHIESQRNEFGARDRAEFEKRVGTNVRRIAFFGDSFTIGHGVPRLEDRFSDRVASGLEEKFPGQYVVANLADPGLEISQIEARIRGVLQAGYQLDRVIYVICLNDIEGYDPETERAIRSLQDQQPTNPLITKTYFLNWLYFRGVQLANRGARDYFPHLVQSYQSAPWNGFSGKLLRIRDDCLRHRVAFNVVVFPFLTELGPGYPFHAAHQKIAAFCEANQIPCLDLEPALTKRADQTLTVNRFDAHPNEKAHAIAAEAILRGLFSSESDDRNTGAEAW